jgi:hypothetical protein
MRTERIPHVELTIEWESPSVATIRSDASDDEARRKAGGIDV